MAMKYEVCGYKDGKPWKFTSVVADNKEEAMRKAQAKAQELGWTNLTKITVK